LDTVSTTCDSGWVTHSHSKSIANLDTDHLPTRYRRWY